jgi:hypothetical protein
LGLIATNTIAQGDTRTTGLQWLTQNEWRIYDAVSSMPWPGTAAVTVSVVHALHGTPIECAQTSLDGVAVAWVNSHLKTRPERPDPVPLASNSSASFRGSDIYGIGFTLTSSERAELGAKSASNLERIFPYLGGEEVNTSPTQSFDRYVVSFAQMPLEEAERWPDLLRVVRERVKPDRDTNKREARRVYWWRFGEYAPGLYAAIAGLDRCLVAAQVTKHLCFSFQPTNWIFSQKLFVFPLPAVTGFSVLQSRVHVPWAWLLSSTMKSDLSYSASECFETFPFPQPDPRAVIPALETAGQALYDARAAYMIDTNQGLTKTYNALKDPACTDPRLLELRALHEAMDRAVLDAYGWTDVEVPPYCPRTDAERAAVQAFEDEVIDRLYVLNEQRAREEDRCGSGKGDGKRVRTASASTEEKEESGADGVPVKNSRVPKGKMGEGANTIAVGENKGQRKLF